MANTSNIKHRFFSAFREIFVHHHGSLEFRAKIFALIVASFENTVYDEAEAYNLIKEYALKLYEDENRANLLVLTTKELVKKVYDDNGLNIDTLISNIQKELKIVPRYAKKIDVDALRPICLLTEDEETLAYQTRILDFLQNLKDETLQSKQEQIEKSEEGITSKFSNTK
ncbi:hypothetical protein FJR48_04430 [Sulfurimonas lithotrophica]|uniref:Uncharacterized protein n=1 Tax=Sulfurimonas lithotrophica TaxID=2590022 RepID=A0A5P8NZY5_9BACT|nr:hypothetical protein [Sulfurimonas lithotrophica]QFR49009.1 hypothetical protein FJR48_04430 [Sulfurimonas lithotrophica]